MRWRTWWGWFQGHEAAFVMAGGTFLFAATGWGLWEEQSVEWGRLAAGLALAAASFGLWMTFWVAKGTPESGDDFGHPLPSVSAGAYMIAAVTVSQLLQPAPLLPDWAGLMFSVFLGFAVAELVQRLVGDVRRGSMEPESGAAPEPRPWEEVRIERGWAGSTGDPSTSATTLEEVDHRQHAE